MSHPTLQVGLLDADTFITAYRWVNDTEDNAFPVLRAKFNHPQGGPIEGHAKLINPHTAAERVMCINEITGWLVARAAGLPVAERAFIAAVRCDELPSFQGQTVPPTINGNQSLFFCTQTISPSTAKGLVASEALVNEQALWGGAHGTIALDELLANPDRHINNFIRRGHRDFVLIDHGLLLNRGQHPCWHMAELEHLSDLQLQNLLHWHSYHYRGVNNPRAMTEGYQKCRDTLPQMAENLPRVLYEVSHWCRVLMPGASAEWLHLLHHRLQHLDALLTKRFALLPLTTPAP